MHTQQGNVGEALAIAYYTMSGFVVSVPLSQNQKYDLVIEKDNVIERVSVKTTDRQNAEDQGYEVELRTKGGNQSYHTATKFDNELVERVFVITGDGRAFDIPANSIDASSSILIDGPSGKYLEHEVHVYGSVAELG